MAFKIIEGLPAILASIQGLAGRAAEFTDHDRMKRITSRAGDRFFTMEQFRMAYLLQGRRRRDAKSLQFFFSFFAHPVGGPGRRKDRRDPGGRIALL